jgi:hypothetical protein
MLTPPPGQQQLREAKEDWQNKRAGEEEKKPLHPRKNSSRAKIPKPAKTKTEEQLAEPPYPS